MPYLPCFLSIEETARNSVPYGDDRNFLFPLCALRLCVLCVLHFLRVAEAGRRAEGARVRFSG